MKKKRLLKNISIWDIWTNWNERNISGDLISNEILEIELNALLNNNIDFNKENIYNDTILIFACKYNLINIINKLLKYNIDINYINKDKKIGLHYACFYQNNYDIVKLLLENGADVNKQDNYCYTPLHYLIENRYNGTKLIIKLFDKFNANFYIKNYFGLTPYDLIREYMNNDFMELVTTNIKIKDNH